MWKETFLIYTYTKQENTSHKNKSQEIYILNQAELGLM